MGKIYISELKLNELYLIRYMSANKIGKKYNCSKIPILRLLKLYDIPLRSKSENSRFQIRTKKSNLKRSLTLKGRPSPNKGKKLTKDWKKKISNSLKGRIITKKHRERIRIALRKRTGKLCPAYIDGRSYKEYSSKFKGYIRKNILKRDNCICQLCYSKYSKKELEIHHRDVNKFNDKESNLITLCKKCHLEMHYVINGWRKECRR